MVDLYLPDEPGARTPRPRSLVPTSATIAALLVAGAAGIFTVQRTEQAHPVSVFSAVDSALASRTADVNITQTLGSLATQASGTMDFSTGEMAASSTTALGGAKFTIAVEYVHGVIYEHMPQIEGLEPGKTWVEVDMSSLTQPGATSSGLTAQGNPAAMLKLLSSRDGHVTPVGAATVDGIPVQSYRVDFNVSALQQQLSKPGVADWIRQSVSATSVHDLSDIVYIDSTNHLRRVETDGTFEAAGKTLHLQQATTFTNYGVAMPSITIPTAAETIPFQQLLQDAKAAQASGAAS